MYITVDCCQLSRVRVRPNGWSVRLTALRLTEVVELLFARGLVKVLFATETFAMVSITAAAHLPDLTRAGVAGCQHASQERRLLGYS